MFLKKHHKTQNYQKSMFRIMRYKLAAFGISWELVQELKPRKLYQLLKKAFKYDHQYKMNKSELKQFTLELQKVDCKRKEVKVAFLIAENGSLQQLITDLKYHLIVLLRQIYAPKFIKLYPISIE